MEAENSSAKIALRDVQQRDCGLQDNEEAGEIALRMKNWIEGIQYGEENHPWR